MDDPLNVSELLLEQQTGGGGPLTPREGPGTPPIIPEGIFSLVPYVEDAKGEDWRRTQKEDTESERAEVLSVGEDIPGSLLDEVSVTMDTQELDEAKDKIAPTQLLGQSPTESSDDEAALPKPGLVISIRGERRQFRKLHRWQLEGSCNKIPGVHYKRFESVPGNRWQDADYDSHCANCWRSGVTPEMTQIEDARSATWKAERINKRRRILPLSTASSSTCPRPSSSEVNEVLSSSSSSSSSSDSPSSDSPTEEDSEDEASEAEEEKGKLS